MELGERYLSELNYEQAVAAFQDTLEIEPMCLPAYAGGIEAYTCLGDTDALQAFYQEAVNAMAAMESEALNENMDLVVEIFVQANEVFADNVEKAVSILEQGYKITDKNEQVANTLVDSYEALVDSYREAEDYESELDIYDRILEVQPNNEDAFHNRSRQLEEYLDYLISEGEWDKAEELIEKYRDMIDDVDFEEYTDRITPLREQAAARENLLQKVYELMAAEDYAAMAKVKGSDEAEAVVETLNGGFAMYSPEGFAENYTGVAVGIYSYSDDERPDYYFYYGDYVNGIREGQGILFTIDSTEYSYYDGCLD